MLLKPFRFSYLNAKSRALKTDINSPNFFDELLSSKNYGDIFSALHRGSYKNHVEEPKYESLCLGLQRSFDTLYKSITKGLSQKERKLFYLFFYAEDIVLDKKIKNLKNLKPSELKQIDLDFISEMNNVLKDLAREDRKDLKKILGSYFDNLNLSTIFRLKILYNTRDEEILPYLFPYGLNFDIKTLGHLLSFHTLNELSNELENVYKESFKDLSEFRRVLYRHHYTLLESVWLGYPFKISIMFALLRMKHIEINNIRTVIEGVKYHQKKSDMERMIVGVYS